MKYVLSVVFATCLTGLALAEQPAAAGGPTPAAMNANPAAKPPTHKKKKSHAKKKDMKTDAPASATPAPDAAAH